MVHTARSMSTAKWHTKFCTVFFSPIVAKLQYLWRLPLRPMNTTKCWFWIEICQIEMKKKKSCSHRFCHKDLSKQSRDLSYTWMSSCSTFVFYGSTDGYTCENLRIWALHFEYTRYNCDTNHMFFFSFPFSFSFYIFSFFPLLCFLPMDNCH